jgi:hypothetical protein
VWFNGEKHQPTKKEWRRPFWIERLQRHRRRPSNVVSGFPLRGLVSSPPDAVKRSSVTPNASLHFETNRKKERKKETIFFDQSNNHITLEKPTFGILSLCVVNIVGGILLPPIRLVILQKSVFIFFCVHFHLSLGHFSPIQICVTSSFFVVCCFLKKKN